MQFFEENGLIGYYAFGAPLDGRTFSAGKSRYGFNGQEKDDEVNGSGNTYSAEYWEYDSRLGRRWNLDPKPTIGISDYSVLNNSPVAILDQHGDKVKNMHDEEKKEKENEIKGLEDEKANLTARYNDVKDKTDKTREEKKLVKQYEELTSKITSEKDNLAIINKKWEATEAIIKEFKDANPTLFKMWDNLKVAGIPGIVDVEVSASFKYLPMSGNDFYQSTEEAVGYGKTKDGKFYIKASLQIMYSYSDGHRFISQTGLLIHGLGHVDLYLRKGKQDYRSVSEPYADKYAEENYFNIINEKK